MTGFLFGLAVAFAGALLLATGSELQSTAVHRTGGRWRDFLRSPLWLAGLLLLGIAVSTNFIALALTPVSAVQSVSIVALAASSAFGALTGRVVVTRGAVASIALCLAGITCFLAIIAVHRADAAGSEGPSADLGAGLEATTTILASLTALGALTVLLGRRSERRPVLLAGLIAGSAVFGSITTVFKSLTSLVLDRGHAAVLTAPASLVSLSVVAAAGIVANVLLQRSHRFFPAPAVVAGITIVDPVTAAVIGVVVLGEASLTSLAAWGLVLSGAIACAGVLGLGRLRRRERPHASPPPPPPAPPSSASSTPATTDRSR
jgi:hypothetical protein